MPPMNTDVAEYLLWMRVHNYAQTTIANRKCYLGYFVCFAEERGIDDVEWVTLELLQEYQHQLFEHRKANGLSLSFGTQLQRLVPVTQFFSWLRRSGRITVNPAADLTMPRPDRRLPEATLTAEEMGALLSIPKIARPLGLRDRAVLEVFYSCGLRRAELIDLAVKDVDFTRGTVFVRCGKGAKDRYVPIGERALFWLRLYVELAAFVYSGRHLYRVPLRDLARHSLVCRLAVATGASVPRPCPSGQAGQLSPAAPHSGDPHVGGRRRHPLRRRRCSATLGWRPPSATHV